ncbi:HAD family hydrolase [Thalassotalea ganghwensis]
MENGFDPLPSWQEGKAKQRIIQFVEQVTDENSPYYVPIQDRIATFDNDGTLWVEKPLLAQLAFYKRQLFDADVLVDAGKFRRILHWLKEAIHDAFDLLKMLWAYIRSGLTTDEYRILVAQWIAHAKHPRYQRKYTELVYLPMREVLDYFSHHGFSNYIVSGGTANFIRPWSEQVYKISADRVIGSSVKTRLSKRNGQLAVKLEPLPFSFEYRSGKVLGIERRLAKRPIAAFGNSLGDVDMLKWTRTTRQSLCVLIHHTDAAREYSYSPDPFYYFGEKTLSIAKKQNWQIVDMKTDWRRIFDFEPDTE